MAARRYLYRRGERQLDVRVRYLVDADGDVQTYARTFEPTAPAAPALIRKREGSGYYALASGGGRAYLSACLNPSGESTVTAAQFGRNRRTYDLGPQRLALWLFNQGTLLDERCLWAQLSVPATGGVGLAYRTLEEAWFAWADRAGRDFPKP
jgi:cyanosortase A-associated protein